MENNIIIRFPHTSIDSVLTWLTNYMNIKDYWAGEKICKNTDVNHGNFYGKPANLFNFPIGHKGNKICPECDATGDEYHRVGCKTAVELID